MTQETGQNSGEWAGAGQESPTQENSTQENSTQELFGVSPPQDSMGPTAEMVVVPRVRPIFVGLHSFGTSVLVGLLVLFAVSIHGASLILGSELIQYTGTFDAAPWRVAEAISGGVLLLVGLLTLGTWFRNRRREKEGGEKEQLLRLASGTMVLCVIGLMVDHYVDMFDSMLVASVLTILGLLHFFYVPVLSWWVLSRWRGLARWCRKSEFRSGFFAGTSVFTLPLMFATLYPAIIFAGLVFGATYPSFAHKWTRSLRGSPAAFVVAQAAGRTSNLRGHCESIAERVPLVAEPPELESSRQALEPRTPTPQELASVACLEQLAVYPDGETGRPPYENFQRSLRARGVEANDAYDASMELIVRVCSRNPIPTNPVEYAQASLERARIDVYRRRNRCPLIPGPIPEVPTDEAMLSDGLVFIRQLRCEIDPIDLELVDRRVAGASYREIADEMGIGETAARQRYHRAIRRIRELFQGY